MPSHRKLAKFLRRAFSAERKRWGHGKILVQLQNSWEMQLPSIYATAAYNRDRGARIVLFQPRLHRGNGRNWIWTRIRDVLVWAGILSGPLGLYRCLGAQELLRIPPSAARSTEAQSLYMKWVNICQSNEALWELEHSGVPVGDLIYDQWLRSSGQATVDLGDSDFQNFLFEAAVIVTYWQRYFERENVVGCIGSAAYIQAVPLRFAAFKNIPSFEININANGTRRFTKSQPRPYLEIHNYPHYFQRLSAHERREGTRWAKAALESRLSRSAVDPWIKQNVAWTDSGKVELPELQEGGVRVLIATHEFSDSPNIFKNLFPDFFQWLRFVGEVTSGTKNQFLLKAHPDGPAIDRGHLSKICSEFPHLIQIDKAVSNSALIKSGIRHAVTVYGSIGIEFAFLGLPVVFSSRNHPYSSYEIGYTPRSVEEFGNLLSRIEKLEPRAKQSDVLEAFFVSTRMNTHSFFYDGYRFPENPWMSFVSDWKIVDHERIIRAYQAWMNSSEYWFLWKSFGVPTWMNGLNEDPSAAKNVS